MAQKQKDKLTPELLELIAEDTARGFFMLEGLAELVGVSAADMLDAARKGELRAWGEIEGTGYKPRSAMTTGAAFYDYLEKTGRLVDVLRAPTTRANIAEMIGEKGADALLAAGIGQLKK